MKKDSLWPAVTVLILYTGLLFSGFAWMLSLQTKQVNAQIEPIKEILTNHITDTNQKIERLTDRFEKLTDRFDKQDERFRKQFENQNDRFNKLYEFLVSEKSKK